jgi:hypothetical protein
MKNALSDSKNPGERSCLLKNGGKNMSQARKAGGNVLKNKPILSPPSITFLSFPPKAESFEKTEHAQSVSSNQ